ncbi:MAG: hypothetical protein AB1585_12955, partial [Thermodesulfobacteriota bacterium]
MAEFFTSKEKQPVKSLGLLPIGVVLGVWFVLNFLTDHLEWFGTGSFYRFAADILYVLLGFTILFSSLIVYSLLYLRGASTKGRIIFSLIVPLAWVFKEIWRMSAIFSWGESFYYALGPGPSGLFIIQLFFLSLTEMFWRGREKIKGKTIRIMTAGPVISLLIFAALVYFMLFWANA